MAVYLNVLHDFTARSPDELSLKKGTQIELIERDDEYGDGWYSGKDLVSGHVGLFPQVYTVLATSGPASRSEPVTLSGTSAQTSIPTLSSLSTASASAKGSLEQNEDQDISDSTGATRLATESNNGLDQEPTLAHSESSTHAGKSIPVDPPSGQDVSGLQQLAIDEHTSTHGQELAKANESNRTDRPADSNETPVAQLENPNVQMMRSPVVQDTLSDIEEAISEITTPRGSAAGHKKQNSSLQAPVIHDTVKENYGSPNDPDDSASDYSRNAVGNESQLSLNTSAAMGYDQNGNYSTQHHTNDDGASTSGSSATASEDGHYTLEEVRSWTPAQVSAYLQEQHIPVPICERFEDQEITGSILLQLEMAHLKELDINSFGKRFQVWKEIERLMETVGMSRSESATSPNGGGTPVRSGSSLGMSGGEDARGRRPRSSTAGSGTVLPRLPSLHNRPPSKKNALSVPRTHREGSSFDASADSQDASRKGSRKTSRRRSSREYTSENSPVVESDDARRHAREPSFDRNWTAGSVNHKVTDSNATGGSRFTGDSGFSGSLPPTPCVLPGSNVSSDEGRRERNVLHKRGPSGSHSRKSSYNDEARARSGTTSSVRHSRLSSVENKSGTTSPSTPMSPAAMAYHMPKSKKKLSGPSQDAYLYEAPKRQSVGNKGSLGSIDRISDALPISATSETLPSKSFHPARIETEIPQTRSVSEGAAKALAMSPSSVEDGGSATPNGGGSASSMTLTFDPTVRRSHESKDNRTVSTPVNKKLRSVASASGIRQKSKKHNTSAWTEGLKEISPAQAAAEGDFSGWVKKRGSGGVVSTWKSRFFVLKGRRLSYFYSETDTKERGLIDITSHRVLNAADDRLVSLHASVAARTTSTPVGQESSGSTGPGATAITPTSPHPKTGWFTFKLVPPAPGAAKGVTFTPPKIHYFATDTKEVGRQWMAAMMKATIDKDETQPVISSFSANTISLAKARELRARPPGFDDDTALEGLSIGVDSLDFDLGSPGEIGTPGSSVGNDGKSQNSDLKEA